MPVSYNMKIWKLRTKSIPPPGSLPRAFLQARGLTEEILKSVWTNIPKEAAEAAQRIARAKRVLVACDYDADGISAAAIILRALKSKNITSVYTIPDRAEDGYGFHASAVNTAKKLKCDLIIAVDCGVNAPDTILQAAAHGIDVIVIDHHDYDLLPEGAHVLHSFFHKPNPHLSAAGLAYKVVQALGLPEEPYLQLAAVSTIADCVRLTNENRAIVREGLKQKPIAGLRALCEVSACELDAENVAFQIAPRLNAASRMGSAVPALQLLLTDDIRTARQYAQELDRKNAERKILTAEAIANCSEPFAHIDAPAGILGIIAGRLADEFGQAAVAVNAEGKGSARAPEGVNILTVLGACPAVKKYGGHARAAGLEINPADVEIFKEQFYAASQKQPRSILLLDMPLAHVPAPEEVKQLQAFGPFGEGFPPPLFLLYGTAQIEQKQNHAVVKVKGLRNVCFKNGNLRRLNGRRIRAAVSLRIGFSGRVEGVVKEIEEG